MIKIAVLADIHLHDVYGDYDFPGVLNSRTGQAATVRALADTINSTRIFNESYFAFQAVLNDLVAQGVGHVVLVGDYSDDGQCATVSGISRLLERYSRVHGLRFYATVGNHDTVQPFGSHQSKRFLNEDGSSTLVTSDPAVAAISSGPVVTTDKMRGLGYRESVRMLGFAGFQKQTSYLHWETPFGSGSDPEERMFEMTSADGEKSAPVPDASYLVEPVEGLWILSIDANVFLPRATMDGFTDTSNAGWDALVRQKPALLDWIRSVTRRAEEQSKRLLVFSHYPLIDYTNGTAEDQEALFGPIDFIKRNPRPETSIAALDGSISVHFSGHLHVDATSYVRNESRTLTNIAVPSLAAYPPAYKLVSFAADHMSVETVYVDEVPRFDEFFEHYRREGGAYGNILESRSYREYLREHLTQLVLHRHLAEDWPADIRALVAVLTGADLLALAFWEDIKPAALPRILNGLRDRTGTACQAAEAFAMAEQTSLVDFDRISFQTLVLDWYRLRNGGSLALRDIEPHAIKLYRSLGKAYGARPRDGLETFQGKFALFTKILESYLSAPQTESLVFDLRMKAFSA
jgi:3',5'-cyclic AMP phosphodiesterase CpdA